MEKHLVFDLGSIASYLPPSSIRINAVNSFVLTLFIRCFGTYLHYTIQQMKTPVSFILYFFITKQIVVGDSVTKKKKTAEKKAEMVCNTPLSQPISM